MVTKENKPLSENPENTQEENVGDVNDNSPDLENLEKKEIKEVLEDQEMMDSKKEQSSQDELPIEEEHGLVKQEQETQNVTSSPSDLDPEGKPGKDIDQKQKEDPPEEGKETMVPSDDANPTEGAVDEEENLENEEEHGLVKQEQEIQNVTSTASDLDPEGQPAKDIDQKQKEDQPEEGKETIVPSDDANPIEGAVDEEENLENEEEHGLVKQEQETQSVTSSASDLDPEGQPAEDTDQKQKGDQPEEGEETIVPSDDATPTEGAIDDEEKVENEEDSGKLDGQNPEPSGNDPTEEEILATKESLPEVVSEAILAAKDGLKGEKAEGEDKKEDKKEVEKHAEHHAEGDEHEDEEHHLDYSNYSKKQMVQVMESMLKDDDFSHIGKVLKEIKPAYEDLYHHEKDDAYKRYLADGGEKDGFEYKDDEHDTEFHKNFEALRLRRNEFYNSLGKQREDNLKRKQDLLEKLRQMIDAEETTASISDLKKTQQEWRNIGPVAPQHMKSLWANYNALLDRYYDNRSIYFELKELDRKKNLVLKLELCDKAEKLASVENIKDAIKELNEYHEEFKLIGPVPNEDQEEIWQRFKTASDQVYSRRKDYFEDLREHLKVNLLAKQALVEKVLPFAEFDSDRISEWNSKTKEVLQLQKEWETIGGLPKEKAKKVNKAFWSTFKTFFNHKGQFFKKLEESRKENLEKKEALFNKAEELKDSDDFAKTAEMLKTLQREWKDIGPVPEKQKEVVYKKFKAACDHFFNRRRENQDQIEHAYVDNLKKKEALCEELENVKEGKAEIERIDAIQSEYDQLGFVPKNAIKTIQKRFSGALADALDKTNLDESEKHKLKFKAQFTKMKFGPNSDKFLMKKENAIRRQVSKLENDISLWKNNLDFFADSKNADKVKEEFNKKIVDASKELDDLKEQLDVINNI